MFDSPELIYSLQINKGQANDKVYGVRIDYTIAIL